MVVLTGNEAIIYLTVECKLSVITPLSGVFYVLPVALSIFHILVHWIFMITLRISPHDFCFCKCEIETQISQETWPTSITQLEIYIQNGSTLWSVFRFVSRTSELVRTRKHTEISILFFSILAVIVFWHNLALTNWECLDSRIQTRYIRKQ